MMGRTHLAAGAATGVILAGAVPHLGVPVLAAALTGSILPDLDYPHSKLGRRVKPISYPIFWIFGHRGGTHSLLFLIVVSALLAAVSYPVGLALGLGIGSHLVADAISFGHGQRFTARGAGVPLAWPLTDRKTGLRLIKVNGLLENLILLPSLVWFTAKSGWGLL